MPSEYEPADLWANSVRPTEASASSTRRGPMPTVAPRARVVAGAAAAVDSLGVEQCTDLGQWGRRVDVRSAVDKRGAGSRPVQPEDHPHRHRLAGPLGPRKRVTTPGGMVALMPSTATLSPHLLVSCCSSIMSALRLCRVGVGAAGVGLPPPPARFGHVRRAGAGAGDGSSMPFVCFRRRTSDGGPGHRISENPSLRRCQLGGSTSASGVRDVTPSFRKTFRRWYSTVLVVMERWARSCSAPPAGRGSNAWRHPGHPVQRSLARRG